MDFYVVLERKGVRVANRKHSRSKIGNFQKVKKEDAKQWFVEKLGGTILP
jgi:large subunit ribosomal protein L11e